MNDMKEHTPGPWHAHDHGGDFIEIEREHGHGSIARVEKGLNAQEDARLIAAAPELLKALRAQIETCCCGGQPCSRCKDSRAVIAKAEIGD